MDQISPKPEGSELSHEERDAKYLEYQRPQVEIQLMQPTPIPRERPSLRDTYPDLIGLKTFNANCVETLLKGSQKFYSIDASNLKSHLMCIPSLSDQLFLENFRVHFSAEGRVMPNLHEMITTNLTQLSLRNVSNLPIILWNLSKFETLEYLALGPMDEHYSMLACTGSLFLLKNLRCLRLECTFASLCSASLILSAVCIMHPLTHLELVNFIVEDDFCRLLAKCKNLKRLLISPINQKKIFKAMKTIYFGLRELSDSLEHVTWNFHNSVETMMQQDDQDDSLYSQTVSDEAQNIEGQGDTNANVGVDVEMGGTNFEMGDGNVERDIASGSDCDIKNEHFKNKESLEKLLKETLPKIDIRIIEKPLEEICNIFLESKWN